MCWDIYFKNSVFLFIQNSDCLVNNCSSCLFFKKCFTDSSKNIVFWLHLKTKITGGLSVLSFSLDSIVLFSVFKVLQDIKLLVAQIFSSSSAKNSFIDFPKRKSWSADCETYPASLRCSDSVKSPSSLISQRTSQISLFGKQLFLIV